MSWGRVAQNRTIRKDKKREQRWWQFKQGSDENPEPRRQLSHNAEKPVMETLVIVRFKHLYV